MEVELLEGVGVELLEGVGVELVDVEVLDSGCGFGFSETVD